MSWLAAGRALGIAFERRAGRSLFARLPGFVLRVKAARGDRPSEIVIENRGAMPRFATIARVRSRSAREWTRVATGDPEFDRRFDVRATESWALAVLLDAERREGVVRALARDRFRVERGVISRGGVPDDARARRETLAAALALARALTALPDEQPGILARHAAEHPDERIRLRCLRILFRDHPETEAARAACARALGDPTAEIRLEAAARSPDESAIELLSLALAPDATAGRRLRAMALRALSTAAAPPIVATAVDEVFAADAPPAVAAEAIRAAGRLGHAESATAIARIAHDRRSSRELVAVAVAGLARIAARCGDASAAEAALVHLLHRRPHAAHVSAARALGRIGGPSSIAALRRAARVLGDASFTRAEREAVERILARHPERRGGSLALAAGGPETGSLSVPPEGVGGLSHAEDSPLEPEERD